MPRRQLSIALPIALLGFVAAPAGAALPGQTHDRRIMSDRANVSFGGFLIDFDTTASVSTGTLIGARIHLESELGLDSDRSVLRLDGFYRFAANHALEYSLIDLSRKGSNILEEQIRFEDEDDDVVFEIDAEVDSRFDSQLLKVTYRYSFINDGRVDGGLSVGLSSYRFNFEIAGIGTVDDGTGGTTEEFVEADAGILAPIPVIGMFIGVAMTENFVFRASADFFGLEIGDYEGHLLDTKLVVDYYFTEHFGIGGGFNQTSIDIRRKGDNPFAVDYRYGGLLGYLGFVW